MVTFRIPGPQCVFTQQTATDDGTLALSCMLPPVPLCRDLLTGPGSTMALGWPVLASGPAARGATLASTAAAAAAASAVSPTAATTLLTTLDNDTRTLAATAYGEGSGKNVFEEMAAIANVLVRQRKARGYASDAAFILADKTFAFAAHDGNARYASLMAATIEANNLDAGMSAAVRGAVNARSETPVDYANGGYFWDGADIKTNYNNHAKVLGGIHFTDPKHNLYAIKEKEVPDEAWWFDAKGKKTKSRGTWRYKYDSTAAWGGTIFWAYNADFLKASGNKVYQ